MNHTPGPWHPHRSESGFVVVYSDGENRSHVARLFDSTLGEEHGSIEANARLIASAPELLASLIELESMVAEMLPKHGPCGWGELALEQARGAIAKATGNNS